MSNSINAENNEFALPEVPKAEKWIIGEVIRKDVRTETKEEKEERCRRLLGKHTSSPVYQSLFQLLRIGESKHEAREKERKKQRDKDTYLKYSCTSPYIHSYETLYHYVKVGERYWAWVQKNYPDVHTLRYAKKMGCPRAYIQSRIDAGLSPYTIAMETSALAKLYRCHAWEIHDDRPPRLSENITRSRNYTMETLERNRITYGDLVDFCLRTGLRRSEVMRVRPDCFFNCGDDLMLHLDGHAQNTKGGRSRDVEILPENQAWLREYISRFAPDKMMFPAPSTHLDIHALRSMYAEALYKAFARPIEEISADERIPLARPKKDNSRPNKVRIDAPALYRRRWDGKVFDRRALLRVAESLGHSRVDVVVLNYLR